ncbi:Uncharacterised protein [Salmonella enterica subsp. enterica serovar Poona]|nr:Uncharacterised protein [Salmonella enterica subsp. enterica serovar Poona]
MPFSDVTQGFPRHRFCCAVSGRQVRAKRRVACCYSIRISELAKLPFVSHIGHPLFRLLINMGEAVESVVPDEEVLPEIFHHPLHLTFSSGPARTAGMWQEVIVVGQQQEPGVEQHFPVVILQHPAFWLSTSTVFTLPPK